MKTPDLFVNVHKGIRRALFETVTRLGRAEPTARELLASTLHFVEHHGANEDLLLIPLVRQRAPSLAQRMASAHELLTPRLEALKRAVQSAPLEALFTLTNRFLAAYLEHMHEEEVVFDPELRAALSDEELAAFGAQSVQRTSPADQLMMLGWMLPAMPPGDAERFLERVPPETAAVLRSQLGR